MANVAVDAAIKSLQAIGIPIPSYMDGFIELLVDAGEDVLTAVPHIISVTEQLGTETWSTLEEVVSGMQLYGPQRYIRRKIDAAFDPHIETIRTIHRNKQALYEYHQETLTTLQKRAGHISPSRYDSLILKWGKADLLEAQPDIEPFLNSPDADLRCQALHALARFRLQEYWSTAVKFLLYDPDYAARIEGAHALGWLQDNTQDHRTLGVLASVVTDSYDDDNIRKSAYRTMRIVAYGDGEVRSQSKPFFVGEDFDWDFVGSSLDPTLDAEWEAEAQEALTQYRVGTLPEREDYALLRKIGRAHLQEAREDVEHFLTHPDELIRTTAFDVLILYLQIPNNWQIAVDILEHDPDDDKRMMAANVLGRLMQGTNDVKTLRILEKYMLDQALGDAVVEACQRIYTGDDLVAFLTFFKSVKSSSGST